MTLDDRGPSIAAPKGRQLDQKLKLKSSKIISRKIYSRCLIGEPGTLHDHYKSSDDPNNHFLLKIDAISSIFSIRKLQKMSEIQNFINRLPLLDR